MKENNEQTTCEQTSSLTQVSTTYARICVILLALNFCITGYVLNGVLKLQQETVQVSGPAAVGASATRSPTSPTSPTPPTSPAVPVSTLEIETPEKK